MDNNSRLQLDKLLKEYNPENTTNKIRELKHSNKIRDDISRMQQLKRTHSRIKQSSPGIFRNMCENQCKFLFSNYTNIFNKLLKDEINLDIMEKFLNVLYNIEMGHLDQHEGSFKVGQILKELFIDSAIKQERNQEKKLANSENKKGNKNIESIPKKISWNEYKMLH